MNPPIDISRVAAHDLAPARRAMVADCPEVWGDFADVLYIAARNNETTRDISDAALSGLIAQQVGQLAFSLGGNAIYIPKGYKFFSKNVAAEIAKAFTGKNINELAKKFNKSTMRIRQILQEQGVHRRPKGAFPRSK